jgi:hypothetical protein
MASRYFFCEKRLSPIQYAALSARSALAFELRKSWKPSMDRS